jgi:ribonuclease P protein component
MLPGQQRLTRPQQFRAIRGKGQRWQSPSFYAHSLLSRTPVNRLGVIVSGKVGKSVQRKRAARVLRAAFKLSEGNISPPLDLVLVARPVVLRKTSVQVAQELQRIFIRSHV